MTSKSMILVMYASQYDITGENGQPGVKGTTLHYMFVSEDLHEFNSVTRFGDDNKIGMQRAKCSLAYEKFDKIMYAPAIYDAEFELTVGSDGKPVLKCIDLDYVSDVKLTATGSRDERDKKAAAKA